MEKSVSRTEPLSNAAQISLTKWFLMISKNDFGDLPSIIASDPFFHSPVEWHYYPGRDLVCLLLPTAAGVYENFKYKSELSDYEKTVLEFSTHIDNVQASVHIIRFNAGREFINIEKMLRPEQAVNALDHEMGSKNRATSESRTFKVLVKLTRLYGQNYDSSYSSDINKEFYAISHSNHR